MVARDDPADLASGQTGPLVLEEALMLIMFAVAIWGMDATWILLNVVH